MEIFLILRPPIEELAGHLHQDQPCSGKFNRRIPWGEIVSLLRPVRFMPVSITFIREYHPGTEQISFDRAGRSGENTGRSCTAGSFFIFYRRKRAVLITCPHSGTEQGAVFWRKQPIP
jgi:hypothetical protein